MTIRHAIMYPLADESDETVGKVRASFARLGALPECRGMEFGVRANDYARSVSVVAIVTFDTVADYEAYQRHDAHQEHVALMRELATGVSFVDYEPEQLR